MRSRWQVTKNCSMGQFENCKCDTKKVDRSTGNGTSNRRDFRWGNETRSAFGTAIYESVHAGGCSDNVEFGVNLARAFLDRKEVGHDPRAVINLHNNMVGRMVSFAPVVSVVCVAQQKTDRVFRFQRTSRSSKSHDKNRCATLFLLLTLRLGPRSARASSTIVFTQLCIFISIKCTFTDSLCPFVA